jgi:hypothetical protein
MDTCRTLYQNVMYFISSDGQFVKVMPHLNAFVPSNIKCVMLCCPELISFNVAPPIPWILGTLTPGVKRPGLEAGHSPPSSAKDTNAWSYIPTPHMSSWHGA